LILASISAYDISQLLKILRPTVTQENDTDMTSEHMTTPVSKLSDQTEGCKSSFMHDLVSVLPDYMFTALDLQKEIIEKKE